MGDALTESVARLYRAGSEHSQQTKKLREAVNSLLSWLYKNVPANFELPCNCRLFKNGEFVRTDKGGMVMIFRITPGEDVPRYELFCISKLIADGFLDKLAEKLKAEATGFMKVSDQIASFVHPGN